MHTEHEYIDPDVLSEMGYEKRDVNIRSIKRWTTGFFLLIFVFLGLAWGFFRWLAPKTFVRAAQGKDPVTRRIPAAPNPLLQDNVITKLDIMALRQAELETLNNYGWANREKTAMRIPIERAKELIAERGAQVVPDAPTRNTPGDTPATNPVAPRNQLGGAPADKAPGGASAGDTAPRMNIPSAQSQPKSPAASTTDTAGTTNDGRTKVTPRAGGSRPDVPGGNRPRNTTSTTTPGTPPTSE